MRLCVAAEQGDVLAHLFFQQVVVGQLDASLQAPAQAFQRASLGRAIFHALIDDQTGGDGGDFNRQIRGGSHAAF